MTGDKAPLFSSRFGLFLATLAMAVGTGNIWRFPRILSKTGGGAFLILWIFFLFAWSVPLIIAEFGLGRAARKGPIGAAKFAGGAGAVPQGGFIAICTLLIMGYYGVVTGWCVRYLMSSLFSPDALAAGKAGAIQFVQFANSGAPLPYLLFSLLTGGVILLFGVQQGIERASRVLMPVLFGLLLTAAIRGLTLDGASDGVRFMFQLNLSDFSDVNIWLEALTQSAWSTGAGWGLVLTYGAYVKTDEKIIPTTLYAALGNNLASILAALAIIPAVFALAPHTISPQTLANLGGTEGLLRQGGPAATGITFMWVPALFRQMDGGGIFTVLFFFALFIAALSSLLAMMELGVKLLSDFNIRRRQALLFTLLFALGTGAVSATNLDIFENQDWVWGLGLLLSGLFVTRLVSRYGASRFRQTCLTSDRFGWFGPLFDIWINWVIPALFAAVISWWFYQSFTWDKSAALNPFGKFTVGTVLIQWGILLGLLKLFGRKLAQKL